MAITNFNGRCQCCGATEPGGLDEWHIDHDHATMKFRGILCHGCNIGIGNLKDDISRLEAAIQYLGGVRKTEPLFLSEYKVDLGVLNVKRFN